MATRINVTLTGNLPKQMKTIPNQTKGSLIRSLLRAYFDFEKETGPGAFGFISQDKFKLEKLNDLR